MPATRHTSRLIRTWAILIVGVAVYRAVPVRVWGQQPALPDPLPSAASLPTPPPNIAAPAPRPSPAVPRTAPPPNIAAPSGVLPGNGAADPADRPSGNISPPGYPRGGPRPQPGGAFDPGATGPGISAGGAPFLGGSLDPRSGWPMVFLDHFRPRPERLERFWVVDTRECSQDGPTDPWPRLRVRHFNDQGELEERDPRQLLAQVAGRTTLIQVQGSLTTPDIALGGLLWTNTWLTYNGAFTPDMVIIAFDWPSERVYRSSMRDINEKGRRAFLAGYHLARFVQGFPPGSRVCLLGQSYGGRVVPAALHLLGGGCLDTECGEPPFALPTQRGDLHLRAVVIAGASDHDWLNPGKRFDRALWAVEALLNLYNRRDEALRLYPFLVRSGHHPALGKAGLSNRDYNALGPLAARYEEMDVHDLLKEEHSLLDAVANGIIAQRIAPYLWNFNPSPPPEPPPTEPGQPANRVGQGRGLLPRYRGTSN